MASFPLLLQFKGLEQLRGNAVRLQLGRRRQKKGRRTRSGAPTRSEAAYWLLAAASICFWIFSRLNEPGVWLGG